MTCSVEHLPFGFLFMEKVRKDGRLYNIALFAGSCERLLDVGTDHAFLPVYAVKNGIAKRAEATDVNPLPLLKAKNNIEKAGLSDRIGVRLADGLDGAEKFSPDVVVISGMGGELIASIMDKGAKKLKNVRFILQPNTREYDLRAFLYSNGYYIYDEKIVSEKNKYYHIIASRRDGKKRKADVCELSLGRINIKNASFPDGYLRKSKTRLEKKIAGRGVSRDEKDGDVILLSLVNKLIKKENEK